MQEEDFTPQARNLQDLAGRHPHLNRLLQASQRLQKIEDYLKIYLPKEFHGKIKMANYQNGQLRLLAPDSAWAYRMQFHKNTLMQELKHDPKWAHLHTIQVRVEQQRQGPAKEVEPLFKNRALGIPQKCAQQLSQLSEYIENEALKGALQRLAARALPPED